MGTEQAFVPQIVMYEDPSAYYKNPAKVDAVLKQFFDGHGFNGVHTIVLCRWFDMNQTDCDKVTSNPKPDRRTFEALELLISKTHKMGGMVHIWAWGDEMRKQTPTRWGLNKAVDLRLQRYIAARLGPLPGWSMGYGYDLDEWTGKNDLKLWHGHMQQHMAHHHFLGGRSGGPNSGIDHKKEQVYEGLDYSGYEHHRPTYAVYAAAMDARPAKPVMSEDRFRIRKKHAKDYNMDLTRRSWLPSPRKPSGLEAHRHCPGRHAPGRRAGRADLFLSGEIAAGVVLTVVAAGLLFVVAEVGVYGPDLGRVDVIGPDEDVLK